MLLNISVHKKVHFVIVQISGECADICVVLLMSSNKYYFYYTCICIYNFEEEEKFIPKRQEKDIISPLIPEGKHPNPC